jgi:hypothetical protein
VTTLNARANNAYNELIDEYERANPDHQWPGFDDEVHAFEEGWEKGFQAATEDMSGLLRILRAGAITSERQNAYDRAIEAVEGLS